MLLKKHRILQAFVLGIFVGAVVAFLMVGCGDNQGSETAADSTTELGSNSTTSNPTTTSATGTEGMSGTSTSPTTTDGGSTTGDSTGAVNNCDGKEGAEGCPCAFGNTCATPNICDEVDNTCKCPAGAKDCPCGFNGTCIDGTECTEQKLCQGCDALDNDYCPLTCAPTDQIGLKEYPNEPDFRWAMCIITCAGPDDPSNCPMPGGLEGQAFCLDSPYGPLCHILCVTDDDCGPAGNCMDWGAPEGDFCAYPNPYNMRINEMDPGRQLGLSSGESCTAETCMQLN